MAQGKRKSNSNPIRIDTTTQGAQYQVWEEGIVLSLRRGSGWESEITAEFNLKEQNLGLNLASSRPHWEGRRIHRPTARDWEHQIVRHPAEYQLLYLKWPSLMTGLCHGPPNSNSHVQEQHQRNYKTSLVSIEWQISFLRVKMKVY